MDRQTGAATGGEVVFVDFAARVVMRREQASAIDWLEMARRCEAQAQSIDNPRVRDSMIRVALSYRAKAGLIVGSVGA